MYIICCPSCGNVELRKNETGMFVCPCDYEFDLHEAETEMDYNL